MILLIDGQINVVIHRDLVFVFICQHQSRVAGSDTYDLELARREDGLLGDRDPCLVPWGSVSNSVWGGSVDGTAVNLIWKVSRVWLQACSDGVEEGKITLTMYTQ